MTRGESVYRYDLGPVLDLVRVPLEGGRFLHWLSVQDGRPGVVVIATDGSRVLLQKQWREAVGASVWQFPRGFGEAVAGTDALTDAARELQEETGIAGARLRVVGRVFPDPGILATEVVVVEALVALDGLQLSTGDVQERIEEFDVVSVAGLDSWIRDGQLVDGITLAALQVWRAGRSAPPAG